MFALEPGELGKIVLDRHEGVDNPPCCVVKAKSARQQREYDNSFDELWKRTDDDSSKAFQDRLTELFKANVERIEGYQSEDIEEAFTRTGMVEILRKLVSGSLIKYEEKKS